MTILFVGTLEEGVITRLIILQVFAKYTPIAFKIYALPFQKPQSTPPPSDIAIEGIIDDDPDLTTGVTTRSLRGVEGEPAGKDTTRSATQVCRRPLESCLGGHEAGVSGVDGGLTRGSRRHRSRYENGDE